MASHQVMTSPEPESDDVGVAITFEDVKYSVPVDKKVNEQGVLEILHGISGCFLPGRMACLMGPSGSGKSTLLDLLAGRKNSGTTTGSILMNGTKPTEDDLRNIVGYVEQFDTLVGELTVYQMLLYTAELKLPATATAQDRSERVEEVIDMLDLGKCSDTVIGSDLQRGISGGQAKRVNIGLALITRPKVLLLDEPTSGLDSRTANEVVDLLRKLCREGQRTVLCTVHSPSGHAFAMFEDLLMLHEGRPIYDGSLGNAQSYFEGLGQEYEAACSLPEWLVDITSDLPNQYKSSNDLPNVEETEAINKTDFAAEYAKSEIRSQAEKHRQNNAKVVSSVKNHVYTPPSSFSKLMTLLKFRMTAHYKDEQFLGTRLGDKVFFGLLILSLYWGIGDDPDPQAITSTATLMYFIAALCGYGAAAFVPSLTLERALYYRELADGCYTPIVYFAAKFIEEGIIATVTSLMFTVIIYFACNLQGSFFILAVTYYLTTMMGIILAYAVAALVPTMEAANALLPTLVTMWMYFGGLFIVFDKIPRGWYWFSWTSFLRYAWGAMMINQFGGTDTGSAQIFVDSDGTPIDVLEFFGMEGSIMGSVGSCIGLLCVLIGFFSLVAILALTYVRHDKR